MKCPKCGFEQDAAKICAACGIVISKFNQRKNGDPLPTGTAKVEKSGGSAGKVILFCLLAVGLGLAAGKFLWAPGGSASGPVSTVSTESLPDIAAPVSSSENKPPVSNSKNVSAPAFVERSVPDSANPIEDARNATVFIRTPMGSGAGFFVDSSGHILTNKHVIEFDRDDLREMNRKILELEEALESERKYIKYLQEKKGSVRDRELLEKVERTIRLKQDQYDKYSRVYDDWMARRRKVQYFNPLADITVTLYDGSEYRISDVEKSDNMDLALLTLDGSADSIKPIKPNFSPLDQGSKVYTIGNPSGLRHTVTAGIVSGYRNIGENYVVQTDAPINPGNSGGPLIDPDGKVIGVNTMILRDTEGIGFAIYIKDAFEEFSREINY